MGNRKTLLDRMEQFFDDVAFRVGRALDGFREGASDLFREGVERVAKVAGTSIVALGNSLVLEPGKSEIAPLRWIRAGLGITVVFCVWVLAQAYLLIYGLVGSLFGIRRGREYLLLENAYVWISLVVLGLVLPWRLGTEFAIGQLVLFYSYAIIILGLDILVGFAGQASLGHGAFVLVGSYITVIAHKNGLMNYPGGTVASIFLGGASAWLVGMVVGLPAARLKGPYLGLLTLGLMLSVAPIVKHKSLWRYTGGIEGMALDAPKPPSLLGLKMIPQPIWMYYLAFFFFVSLLITAHILLRRTKLGRAFIAVHEMEEKANVLGINEPLYKMLAFGLSAFYAGVGGGLISLYTGFLAPDSVTIRDSLDYLVAVVLGGRARLFGAILGATFLTLRSFVTSGLSKWISNGDQLMAAVYGFTLLFVLVMAPRGIAGEISHWFYMRRFRLPTRRKHRRDPFPDYELDEEVVAVGTLQWPDLPAPPEGPKPAPTSDKIK